jgi:beta-aspartyl-dipeptidase (metallo-type)
VLLDEDLAVDTVIARGKLMMKDRQLLVRGTYE